MGDIKIIYVIIKIILLVSIGFILPQGLSYYGLRLTKNQNVMLRILTISFAPFSFIIISQYFWNQRANAIEEAGHYVCGAFGAASVFATIYGALFHLILAGIIFVLMSIFWKRKSKTTGLEIP